MAKLIEETVDLAQYTRGHMGDWSRRSAVEQEGVVARFENGTWVYYLPKPKVVSAEFTVPKGWRATTEAMEQFEGDGTREAIWHRESGEFVGKYYVREDED